MQPQVTYKLRDGIAHITFKNPPLNALNAAVRADLVLAFERATAEAREGALGAVLLYASGRTFAAGTDIRETTEQAAQPSLSDLCRSVEECPVPVVALIHGRALGTGFELALAAHYRIAAPAARIGMPDVTLGLVPQGGATQRLPRLVAADVAVDLLFTGRPLGAASAHRAGLVDAVSEGDLIPSAEAFAARLRAEGRGPRRSSEGRAMLLDPGAFRMALSTRRAELPTQAETKAMANWAGEPNQAPAKILQCIEVAAIMPFEAGLAFENDAFEESRVSLAAQGLRHALVAERAAARAPLAIPRTTQKLQNVAVMGATGVAPGLVVACLDAGCRVQLLVPDAAAVQVGAERVVEIYNRAVSGGRLDPKVRAERLSRLAAGGRYDVLSEVDLILDCFGQTQEKAAARQQIFAPFVSDDTVIAITTPHLDVVDLALGAKHGANMVGMTFLPPTHIMKPVEITVTRKTPDQTIAQAFAAVSALGKTPIYVQGAPVKAQAQAGREQGAFDAGPLHKTEADASASEPQSSSELGAGVGARLTAALRHSADLMVMAGASIYEVDDALRNWGFALGPYEAQDLQGLDIANRDAGFLAAKPTPLRAQMIAEGWLGQRAGRGYYLYEKGSAQGRQDPDVLHLIERARASVAAQEHSVVGPARDTSPETIQKLCLFALVNEGARMLEAGHLRRAGDIDALFVQGYGFPRWRGGPMFAGAQYGLLAVQTALLAEAAHDPFWTPCAYLAQVIKNGGTFSTLL